MSEDNKVLTEESLQRRLKEWMKSSEDPITQELVSAVGRIQLIREKFGNISLDEAIEKTSRIVLARLIEENNKREKTE